jgi:hypothetical protein
MNSTTKKRPIIVTIIVIINILGWIATEALWVMLFINDKIPAIESMNSYYEKAYIGLVNGFAVSDLVWSNLILLISIIGLWKMSAWGWTAAFMGNTIWLYTITFTLVRDILTTITATTIFFSCFAGFAIFSTIYLWNSRRLFWSSH